MEPFDPHLHAVETGGGGAKQFGELKSVSFRRHGDLTREPLEGPAIHDYLRLRGTGEISSIESDLRIRAGLGAGGGDEIDVGAGADAETVEVIRAAIVHEVGELHVVVAVGRHIEIEERVAFLIADVFILAGRQLFPALVIERERAIEPRVDPRGAALDEHALALFRGEDCTNRYPRPA